MTETANPLLADRPLPEFSRIEPAHVKGRGLWYRVRIGPFKYRHSAVIYRQEFEAKERLVTFIVEPPKVTVRVQPSAADGADADE